MTKTFLRQKILVDDPPVLRYAIHLKVVCPKKGRYYLYSHIRIVFPIRQPDPEEKVHTILQTPSEPKYYPYTEEIISSFE